MIPEQHRKYGFFGMSMALKGRKLGQNKARLSPMLPRQRLAELRVGAVTLQRDNLLRR
jgi:hypothetical protein